MQTPGEPDVLRIEYRPAYQKTEKIGIKGSTPGTDGVKTVRCRSTTGADGVKIVRCGSTTGAEGVKIVRCGSKHVGNIKNDKENGLSIVAQIRNDSKIGSTTGVQGEKIGMHGSNLAFFVSYDYMRRNNSGLMINNKNKALACPRLLFKWSSRRR